jgi:acid phosphatase type 7
MPPHRFAPLARPLLVAALFAASTALAAELSRGPFIQQTSETSALVVVHTSAQAHVELFAQVGAGEERLAQSQGRIHRLWLHGLQPASALRYTLRVNGSQAFGPAQFRTPGRPGTALGRQAVVGVIGDMGSGGPNEHANVRQLAARGVELVLTVGDNSYPNGAAEEWDPKFFLPFAPLLPYATLAPALGDHEYLTPGAQGYLDAFELPEAPANERYYSFDWGDLHVAVVDSNCVDPLGGKPIGCTAAQMVAWLDEDLRQSQAPWKVVTLHRPALASGRYGTSVKVAQALVPLFEAHQVDLVLQGHNHFYERSWPVRAGAVVQRGYQASGAPVYVTSGGGGDWIYESPGEPPVWSAFRATAFQHLQLTLDGERLQVDSVRPDGTLLDTFTLQKPLPPIAEPAPLPKPLPAPMFEPAPATPPSSAGAQAPAPPAPPAAEPAPKGCSSAGAGGLALLPLWALGTAVARRRRRSTAPPAA